MFAEAEEENWISLESAVKINVIKYQNVCPVIVLFKVARDREG